MDHRDALPTYYITITTSPHMSNEKFKSFVHKYKCSVTVYVVVVILLITELFFDVTDRHTRNVTFSPIKAVVLCVSAWWGSIRRRDT